MQTRKHLWLVSLLLAGALATHAHADDDDDSGSLALLQRARVAQDVEHDDDKARALLTRIWKRSANGPVGRLAGLRLAGLLKHPSVRMSVYRMLTDIHAEHMTPEERRTVHDAMASLLKPGESAKTPLGTVFVRGDVIDDDKRSPVERKIAKIFQVHNVQVLPFQHQAEAKLRDLDREVRALGDAATPVLNRYVSEGEADQAFNAAVMLGRTNPKATIRGYVRAIRLGRAAFRVRVIAALRMLPAGDLSAFIVEQVEPLLELEDIADVHARLTGSLGKHLSDEQVMVRATREQPANLRWSQVAVARSLPEVIPVLLAHHRVAPESPASKLLVRALRQSGMASESSERVNWGIDLSALTPAQLQQAMSAALETSARLRSAQVAARLWELLSKTNLREAVESNLWLRVRDATSTDDQRFYLDALRLTAEIAAFDPPAELFASDEHIALLLQVLPRARKNPDRLPSWMKGDAFATRVAEMYRDAKTTQRAAMEVGVARIMSFDEQYRKHADRCLEIFLKPDFAKMKDVPLWVWKGAATTGNPMFIKRLNLFRRAYDVAPAAIEFYAAAGGKGIAAMAAVAAKELHDPTGHISHWAIKQLVASADEASHAMLAELLESPRELFARLTLHALNARVPGQREILVGLYRRAASSQAPLWWAPDVKLFRMNMVAEANAANLREAIPFLVRMYESEAFVKTKDRDERQQVVDALDGIRAYHERLHYFKRWADEGEDDDRELMSGLEDDDATIRRAAVMAFAALRGRSALTRLLSIAKDDKDEAVRTAALKAIERVSLMMEPAVATPGAK